MGVNNKQVDLWIQQLTVLVVDDNQFMRKLVRGLLLNIGVSSVLEAGDGLEALEEIRNSRPDMVILDWEMPLLNGPELVRIVRSPGVFPHADIPIIMLTAFGERRRILESVQIGVNEFLCKPVSAKALYDRIVSILVKPRASVQVGDYYGPEPRRSLAEMEAAAGIMSSQSLSPPTVPSETPAAEAPPAANVPAEEQPLDLVPTETPSQKDVPAAPAARAKPLIA